jgi:hypothetical protein
VATLPHVLWIQPASLAMVKPTALLTTLGGTCLAVVWFGRGDIRPPFFFTPVQCMPSCNYLRSYS